MGNIAEQYHQAVEQLVGSPAAQKTSASLLATFGITELTFDMLNGPLNTLAIIFGLYLTSLMIKHRRLQIAKEEYEFAKIKEAQKTKNPMQSDGSPLSKGD